MGTNKSSVDSLARRVESRQKFIVSTVGFVAGLLSKHGVVAERHEGSAHTNTVYELRNVNNFSFRGDFGQTVFGGNSIKIWYNRGGKECLVFNVYYQATLDECLVSGFDDNADWKVKLKDLKKRIGPILRQLQKKKSNAKDMAHQEKADEVKKKKLEEKAKRLGLNI